MVPSPQERGGLVVQFPQRTVGSTSVSAIGLGCMNLSHAYLPRPEPADAERLLLRALDLGITFFDTAALYGFGANEALLGRALIHRRSEFILASKCVLAEIDGKRGLDGSPTAIARVLEDSLRRLNTDHIDLYYLHRLDPKVPIEESVGALARAFEAGKIGAIGLSEMSAATLRRAHAVHPIAAMQTEYSLFSRNAEIAVLEACRELRTAFVAFSPLGRGMLSGHLPPSATQAPDLRATFPRFQPPHVEANLLLASKLAAIARSAGCTAAQLSLAWLLSRGEHVVPIPGTTSLVHLEENMATLSVSISADALAKADALFRRDAVSGPRYARSAQAQIDTEIWDDEPLDMS